MEPMQHQTLIRELRSIVGISHVLETEEDRHVYGYDASVYRGTGITAVVLPESTEQIAKLVQAAR